MALDGKPVRVETADMRPAAMAVTPLSAALPPSVAAPLPIGPE